MMQNSAIITAFIEQVWNQEKFQCLPDFLDTEFKDHALPASFPYNQEGLKQWVITTGHAFKHQTTINELVCENNTCIAKITMHCIHIGTWRNIEATGQAVQVTGYRHFRLKNGKITDHWALIDGQTLENKLLQISHGCKPAQ